MQTVARRNGIQTTAIVNENLLFINVSIYYKKNMENIAVGQNKQ